MAVLSIGQVWADDPAAVGTTLFSEDFSSYSADNVPSGSVSAATGRVIYGGGSVTYTSTNGTGSKPGTTKIWNENTGGGTAPEILVGKQGTSGTPGSFKIAGIPSGGAQVITVSWTQNKQLLTGILEGTGYSTTYNFPKPTTTTATISFDITVADGADETFDLTLRASSSNVRVDDIRITVKTAGEGGTTCTSEITITKADDPANGTFALDNSGTVCIDEGNATVNVTATPADHYHLATVTSTVGTVGTISGNTCAITDIDADTEIGVTFAEDDKVKVTWNVNGDETLKTDVYVGEKPVFPATPAACDATSTTFIGWATAPWTGKLADLSEKTVYTSASAMPDVDAAVTYYAVFAKSSGSASELFSWAGGGKEALLAIEGIVSSSLDADYAASHSPYQVKWNGDGKYLIIPVSARPGKLSVGFKMIGGATTSTVDVQESTATDGEFTNVETLTISGASNDIVSLETTNAFKSTTRAIKLLYHKGSNVGLGPISIESAVSMSDYMTTCCTKYNVNIAAGIENGSVSADPASACEGATITLTFTPALNYHLSAWTLNGAAQDIAENTFEMPGADVTVSATFAQDACEPLGTPSVTVSGKAYPYNAVQLAWTAIEHADAYKVYIYDNEDNELEHNDAFAGEEYTIGQTLSASTTYKYSVQAISNTPATYCPSTEAASTFTTDALPTAHLTLIALGEEHASSGDYAILTPFALPSTAASCSKAFVGWDANPDCATAPTYAKGAEFQFNDENDVILYAVYADETPGAVTLTKLGSGATFADGDKLVIAAKGTNFGLYFENAGSAYVKNWEFEGEDPVLSELTDSKKILTLVKSGDNWKFGDATNGYFYSSSSNNLEISTTNSSEFNSFSWNTTESAFTITKTDGRYLNCRTDLTSTNANLWRFNGTNTNAGSPFLNVYKYAAGASTFDNYSTTCVAAPTAEPASASIAVAAAGGEGTLGVSYENVNLAGVTAALFNNEACTEAFDGGWLTASIAGDDKHIAYNAQANTSYNDARTAYIKLTAPETNGAANPAVVVIPVEQAKKPAVFDNLADLVAANIATGTQVTVSFEEVITNDQTISGPKRAGLYLTTTAGSSSKAIEIFYNKGTTAVPAEWVIGGKLAATSMTFTWTLFNSDQWELVPLGNDWTWDNGDLTYTAPKAVSSVVVSGSPAKTSYVDGEKFKPAGLTVTVNYTEGDPEVNPTGVTFACTPERVTKETTSVNVVATFNEVPSEAFAVTGFTVGDIQLKTVDQFIEAGNADMRCYLEGIVSDIETGSKLKYGNFNLTDATGTIYVYGCLNQDGEAQKFDELGVQNGDKIKVIAEDYEYYSKHEAKNVQFVSKISPVQITIADKTLNEGEEWTIVATTDPAAAVDNISYSIKAGSDDCITLDNVSKKITANSVGTATIIASIPDGEGYIANSIEFEVKVVSAPAPFVGDYFVKVADNSELTSGEYLIVYETGELAFDGALTTLDAIGNTVAVTFDNGKIQGTTAVLAATFTIDVTAGTLQSASGYYIGQESDANGLAASTETAYTNTISIDDDGKAVIVSSGGAYLRYNSASNQARFRYYKSATYASQQEITLYKKEAAPKYSVTYAAGEGSGDAPAAVEYEEGETFTVAAADLFTAPAGKEFDKWNDGTNDYAPGATYTVGTADVVLTAYWKDAAPEPSYTEVRNGLTEGWYYTMCLDKAVTAVKAGSIWRVLSKAANGTDVILEEVIGTLDAGRPYIFRAAANTLEVAYTGDAVLAPVTEGNNGLIGSFSQEQIPNVSTNYIIYNNALYYVNTNNVYVGEHRAYLNMNGVPNYEPQQGNNARRRVTMAVYGKDEAQGFDNLESGDAPKKVMIDGTLYIFRGEKQYDATGRLVK